MTRPVPTNMLILAPPSSIPFCFCFFFISTRAHGRPVPSSSPHRLPFPSVLAEAAGKTRSQPTAGEAKAKVATSTKRASSSGASGSTPSGKKPPRSQQPAGQTAGSKRQRQQETMGVKQQRSVDGHAAANGTRGTGGKGHVVNGTRHVNGTRPQRGGGAAGGGLRKEGGGAVGGRGGRGGSVIGECECVIAPPHAADVLLATCDHHMHLLCSVIAAACGKAVELTRCLCVAGVVGARMSGEQMVGSAGMANATGRLELRLVNPRSSATYTPSHPSCVDPPVLTLPLLSSPPFPTPHPRTATDMDVHLRVPPGGCARADGQHDPRGEVAAGREGGVEGQMCNLTRG
ncbi:unnamed protein product [Closterium sp. Naga37s-1]|nr:unnamed protein product [Closterium sp. Naga37s-1]